MDGISLRHRQTRMLLDTVRTNLGQNEISIDVKLILWAYAALTIDMTARNMQDAVKKKGLPWSAAKGFDTFTPTRYVALYLG